MNGFICLHRKLLSKPVWLKSTPEQCKILIALLLMANYKENEWEWKGQKINCAAGQLVTSVAGIQKACGDGISRQNVRTALQRFKKYEFLTMQSTSTGMLITIVNWQEYQDKNYSSNQVANQFLTNGQPTPNQRLTTNNNNNNDNNINNTSPPKGEVGEEASEEKSLAKTLSSRFDAFWEVYPKKKSKGDAFNAFKALSPNDVLLAKMLLGIKTARESWQWRKEGGQFIPYPATWLRAKGWEDEASPPNPQGALGEINFFNE